MQIMNIIRDISHDDVFGRTDVRQETGGTALNEFKRRLRYRLDRCKEWQAAVEHRFGIMRNLAFAHDDALEAET